MINPAVFIMVNVTEAGFPLFTGRNFFRMPIQNQIGLEGRLPLWFLYNEPLCGGGPCLKISPLLIKLPQKAT